MLRNRLRCTFDINSLNDENENNKDEALTWLSLNEVVIGRGPSSFLSNLDLYINDYLITTIQGDGKILNLIIEMLK